MDEVPPMPATLNDAIATEPMWLQVWVGVLIVVRYCQMLWTREAAPYPQKGAWSEIPVSGASCR